MKSYCDSCTRKIEVKSYVVDEETFYWCAECAEEADL